MRVGSATRALVRIVLLAALGASVSAAGRARSNRWAATDDEVERVRPTRRARLDDVYVHESGPAGAPAVVFVHGGGPSGAMWRDHLDRLAGEFHCLAPDLPGFGRSNMVRPISLSQTADLVAALITDRVPARRAHVVGLSYGGSVVLALVDRHPEALDRILIDGACVLPQRTDPLVLTAVTLVSPLVNTWLAAAFLRRIGWGQLGVALHSASPAAFRRSWKEGYTAPISRTAVEAACPTLLVAGEREHARASNAGLAALMPHATARFVPGLGHAWFVWRRELHLRMVRAWLTGEPLPDELEPEPPSSAAAARILHQIEHSEDRRSLVAAGTSVANAPDRRRSSERGISEESATRDGPPPGARSSAATGDDVQLRHQSARGP